MLMGNCDKRQSLSVIRHLGCRCTVAETACTAPATLSLAETSRHFSNIPLNLSPFIWPSQLPV